MNQQINKQQRQANYNTPINGEKPWKLIRKALEEVEPVDWQKIVTDLEPYYSWGELYMTVGKTRNYFQKLMTGKKKFDIEHKVGQQLLAIHGVFYDTTRTST